MIQVFAGLVFLSFINGSTEPRVGLKVGDRVPQINHPLFNGQPFHTDSLLGKMVLIDFWASYDAPSRIESYDKHKLLQTYQNSIFLNGKGFEVVSVSLDRFRTPLLHAIEQDQLERFKHLCDFQGRKSGIAKRFNNQNKLTSYLVDGDGRIVATSNDIGQISHTLKQLVR